MIATDNSGAVLLLTLAISILVICGLMFALGAYYVLDRIFLFHCKHEHVRCIHGDEIIFGAGGRRVRCEDCGRALDRPLPRICSTTGEPHPGMEGT